MPKKLNYDFLSGAKTMPPLKHKIPGENFKIEKSEVANWLIQLPEIKQKIFDMANNNGVIVYDNKSQQWKGADYDN